MVGAVGQGGGGSEDMEMVERRRAMSMGEPLLPRRRPWAAGGGRAGHWTPLRENFEDHARRDTNIGRRGDEEGVVVVR